MITIPTEIGIKLTTKTVKNAFMIGDFEVQFRPKSVTVAYNIPIKIIKQIKVALQVKF